MKGAGPQILGTGAKFKRVQCQKSYRVNRAYVDGVPESTREYRLYRKASRYFKGDLQI